MQRPTFIVLSVINFKDKPLSYSKVRSTFTPEQRIDQTLKTISSIRENVPRAHVLLIEAGLSRNISVELEKSADRYEYIGDRFLVRKAIDSRLKGIGEAVSLLFATKYIPADSDFCFKISGRYYLNENFNLADWKEGEFIALKYGEDISTRLYGFKKTMLGAVRRGLWISIPVLLGGSSIEHVFTKYLPQGKIKSIPQLGISGLGAAFGDSFKE